MRGGDGKGRLTAINYSGEQKLSKDELVSSSQFRYIYVQQQSLSVPSNSPVRYIFFFQKQRIVHLQMARIGR